MIVYVFIITSVDDATEVHVYRERESIIQDLRDENYHIGIDDDQIDELERDGEVELSPEVTLSIVQKTVSP